ncbi:hypothetical protein [Vibrio cincinnatiensis]|uniref:hypothetical protein n=1 Tax=Vibrio cincinnatiensis TaxID=675 RepID=UPI001EDE662C|nr:hypothetical protein [Vibrio cincinnatiensis]MCG3728992.1 hypothetical protein [Vibrio cincinnatiensis]
MIEDNEMDTQELDAANDPNFNEMLQDLGAVDGVESGEEESDQTKETELDPAAAVAMVEMGMVMSEQYIASASGLPFEFDEKSKDKFLAASGPLMQKHGLTWLAWFEQWKEELIFSGAALGLYLSSRKQLMKLQTEHMGASANDGEKTTDTATAAA